MTWYRSIFTVVTPAGSNLLLTTAEAKAALGITDSSRDADVARIVRYISAAITKACKIRTDGINQPTLLAEDVKDVFRFGCTQADGQLMLSRRRVSAIVVTEGVTELVVDDDYELDPASGILRRLGANADAGSGIGTWPVGVITIEYTAGFADVPDDLKLAAEQWLRELWSTDYQTPSNVQASNLRLEDIPGVRRVEYFQTNSSSSSSSSSGSEGLPDAVYGALCSGGYIETWFG